MRLPQAIWTNLATELVTAGVFAFLWSRPIPVLQSISLTLLCSLFILVAVVDFRYRLVLNVVIIPAMALTLMIRWLAPDTSLLAVLLGGAFGFAIFEMAGVIRPGELGAGDVKLATLVGLVFGFPDALWALLVAVMAGGIVTFVLLLSHRGHSKSLIPYAPFLSIGAMIALFYNPVALIFRSFVGH
jgi:prepilin signal peptidase PulO-like enzyme (type II secretory pathway)